MKNTLVQCPDHFLHLCLQKRVWSGSCRKDAVNGKTKFGMGLKAWKLLFPVFSYLFNFFSDDPPCPRLLEMQLPWIATVPLIKWISFPTVRDVRAVIQTMCLRGKGELGKALPAQGKRQFWEKKKHFKTIKTFCKSASWHSIKCCLNGSCHQHFWKVLRTRVLRPLPNSTTILK